jgi:hypothetical protein
VNRINEVDFNNLAERQHFGDIYEQILTDLDVTSFRITARIDFLVNLSRHVGDVRE